MCNTGALNCDKSLMSVPVWLSKLDERDHIYVSFGSEYVLLSVSYVTVTFKVNKRGVFLSMLHSNHTK